LKAQELVLRQNPDVVIATPGRLIDHIKNTPSFSLDSIEVKFYIHKNYKI
jgi:ATP-dependent RNA helicase DDX27